MIPYSPIDLCIGLNDDTVMPFLVIQITLKNNSNYRKGFTVLFRLGSESFILLFSFWFSSRVAPICKVLTRK